MRFFLLTALASSAVAHHMFTGMSVSGRPFGDGTCIRVPPNTNPLVSLSDKSITCNINGDKAVARICDVDAGQEITFTWRTWPDGSRNDPIDVSHQGPCAVYMKKVNSFNDAVQGDGWFKIWHEGYENGMFCAERLRRNGGIMTARVPKDLADGEYLVRAEMLALHEAQNIGGAQWYVSCAQLHVYSTGGDARPPTVSIPGYTTPDHPGVHYNIWTQQPTLPYHIPGPEPYVPTSGGGGPRIGSVKPPVSCPVSNANWCSRPVPGFSDEAGCYRSSGDCWAQLDVCYREAPATGNKGCMAWEKICEGYNAHCQKCGAERNCNGGFQSKRRRVRAFPLVGEKKL
ncbi:family 61 glycoside hydrolase [Choiromyces venosus 120613-1]|uniref:AA9 family lytic polysaccharide monooxygenase n=1 Tax=Choiromyces venosus 120613-1 TaxID=1336337 RepID=A0A3N4IWH8_9PEZI|nr:family 61 glycoside hydrolase [Choiromyces venosus 120613-1]